MAATKMEKIGYWVATALFLLPMAGTGIPELVFGRLEANAATLAHLGYPLYLPRILGLAKVLGAVAIVSNRSVRLKEWAYAGYTFTLLGAVASHLFAGDGPLALAPAIMLVFVLASYRLWQKQQVAAPGRELPAPAV